MALTLRYQTFLNLFERPLFRALAFYPLAFAIGVLSGHGTLVLMPSTFLFIALFRLAPTRWTRWALALGYYGGFLVTMFPGAAIFFGHSFDPWGIFVLWATISAALSLPWVFLCNTDPIRLAWAVPACIALETLPPLGLLSVGNPLNSAGVLFPHTAWFGLIAVLLLSGLPALFPKYALPTIALISVFTTLFSHPAPVPPGWTAVNTTLGGQGLDTPDADRNWKAALYIQHAALGSHGNVIVFPESLVQWNEATEAFWKGSLDKLRTQHRTMVLGATILQPGRSGDYRNVAVLRGFQNNVIDQRIPIPFTMWNPMSSPTVPLNLYGSSIISADQQRGAVLICYEQLLALPLAESMTEKPTLIVGIANDYWAKGTYFPNIQKANLAAWGKLFNLPVLTAVNE